VSSLQALNLMAMALHQKKISDKEVFFIMKVEQAD
jgi:hypothetical protein